MKKNKHKKNTITNVDTLKKEYKCNRLKNFSISFLAIVLGLVGFALVYQKAEHILGLTFKISNYLFGLSLIIFTIIIAIYIAKLIKYPNEIKKELNHPVKLNFFPLLSKILLIIAIFLLTINLSISKYFWWIGLITQLIFTLTIMSTWIRHEKYQIYQINPSWFVPIVGNIMVPIAGIKHFSPELSWFFFTIGIFWWLVLFTIIMYRIIFHAPIIDKLIPTLFILFAPPAIGFISYIKLTGEFDTFARLLYYFAFFLFILVMCQFTLFSKIKFYLSWWAYSFPVVALTLATILFFEESNLYFFYILSWMLFLFLNFIIVYLTIITIKAIKRKELCIEEKE